MQVLITYDVSTTTVEGRRRLRRVAKTCLDYGQRVQNSVFECLIDPAQLVAVRNRLLQTIDPATDSLRSIFSVVTGITGSSTTAQSHLLILRVRSLYDSNFLSREPVELK